MRSSARWTPSAGCRRTPADPEKRTPMSKHILVAEDDLASSVLLTELLTRWGYEVTVAPNGREALDLLASRPADLLLLDLQMPVLDGFATLAEVRGNSRLAHLPAIALTAFAMRE